MPPERRQRPTIPLTSATSKPAARDTSPDLDYFASMYPEYFGTPPPSSKDTPEVDKEWSEGDFKLVSSDGIHFRTQSYYLYAASSVLRRAHDLASDTPKSIEFTDLEIETAQVLRLFLRLATGQRPTISANLQDEHPLLLFLRKWECEGLVQTVLVHLREVLRSRTVARPVFPVWIAGALVRDVDTCSAALQVSKVTWIPGPSTVPTFRGMQLAKPGASVFDPTGWSIEVWQMGIPPEYLCALARAFGDVGASDRLGGTFKKYLEEYAKRE